MGVGTSGAKSAPRHGTCATTRAPARRRTTIGSMRSRRRARCRSAVGTGDELGIDPDDLPDGLVIADENGRVICFNAAAARITAVPAADALGRHLERPFRWRTSKAAAGGS